MIGFGGVALLLQRSVSPLRHLSFQCDQWCGRKVLQRWHQVYLTTVDRRSVLGSRFWRLERCFFFLFQGLVTTMMFGIYRHIFIDTYIYIVGLVNSKFFCQDHAISSTIFFVNDTYYGVWWSFGWAPRHTSLLMRWDLETRWSKAQTDPRFSCFALDK